MADTPEARLARWTERDTAIGLVAEVEQLRARLADRDREVANLRERCAELGHRVAGLEIERSRLGALVASAPHTTLAARIYRRTRRFAGRVLRR
jgi:hypothetical protein